MNVEHIQSAVTADFGHSYRQGQRVIGIFEQRIIVDGYGVKFQARGIFGKSEWAFVAEKMDFVAASRAVPRPGSWRGCAAADAGIAGDADF